MEGNLECRREKPGLNLYANFNRLGSHYQAMTSAGLTLHIAVTKLLYESI